MNRRIRKYCKRYLIGRNKMTNEQIYNDFLKYSSNFKNKSVAKKCNILMKEAIIDYSICLYCGVHYNNNRCYVGKSFYDDNIDTCCVSCASKAGLDIY
jgi:hypothetical protein